MRAADRAARRGLLGLALVACHPGAADCPAPPASAAPRASASASEAVRAEPPAAAASEPADDPSPPEVPVVMERGKPGPALEEARAIWAEAVALARDAKPRTLKCQRVVSATTRYALMRAPPLPDDVKKDEAAYLRIARCAEQLGSWGVMSEIGRAMARAEPEGGHPEILARALLGKRQPAAALKWLDTAAKRAPKDPQLALTRAKVECVSAHWKECKAAAERAIGLSDAEPDAEEKRRAVAGAHKYVARALVHLGELDAAEQEVALAEKLRGKWADIEDLRDEIAMGRRHAAVVDVEADDEVPLGAYHLIGKLEPEAPMLRVRMDNLAAVEARFRVEVEIAGVIQPASETVTIKARGARWVDFNPTLRPDFALGALRGPTPSTITVKVTKLDPAGDVLVVQRSVATSLSPRDYLPMGTLEDELGRGFNRDSRYVAAWITPNDKAVEAFLTEAKQSLRRGQSFNGPQSASVPQVRALFEALRKRGVSYVMDPEVLTKDVKSQRTRLPAEVLASTNAQCLEGAILYATLLEAIGLSPAIVYVPGHAFLAWRPSKDDKTSEPWLFLETTMTGGAAPFEKAMEAAKKTYDKEKAGRTFHLADITLLRKDGVTPQPQEVVLAPPK